MQEEEERPQSHTHLERIVPAHCDKKVAQQVHNKHAQTPHGTDTPHGCTRKTTPCATGAAPKPFMHRDTRTWLDKA
jgi:hypothetical protein